MTTEQPETISFKNFCNSVLPWIVMGGALVLYFFTLNHFVRFSSLPIVAKVSGWDWQTPVAAPLYYVITLPVRWLPPAWQALALNAFSAVCATLTLALLARSVALLPQDRTKEQRSREHNEFSLLSIPRAWIPPVLAVLLCAFQLTFWENATVASGEMLDLLLFAYVIRCLLEFRLSENQTWLSKFAFVYGLGMANNWAMVGYFPLFLVALVWIRGLLFFDRRFIGRTVLFGAAGLLLYFLLPLVHALNGSETGFWDTLKTNLAYEKNLTLNNPFIGGLKFDLLTMALTSLIPMLLVGIRWTADYADISPIGTMLTNYMFRVLHLALLVFCVWVFFDYKFSPRVLARGFIPFLTFYYLSAISAGYLCGYILLVFGHEGERAWGKSRSPLRKLNKLIAFTVAVAAIGVPLWLFYRSFATVRELNGPALKHFAKLVAKTLPRNAVVLSDDASRLYLMQALHASEPTADEQIFLNTRFLPTGRYQRYLQNRFPEAKDSFVSVKDPRDSVDSFTLIEMVRRFQSKRPVYYLHPSFGYYFEQFYPRQRGLVYELKPFVGDQFATPKLEDGEIEENENFWKAISPQSLKSLTVLAEDVQEAAVLCTMYSSALNAWGVELQRNHQLKLAEEKFYIAWNLDPNNAIAKINGRYNVSLQQGNAHPITADEALIKELNYLHGVIGAFMYFGPVDEPSARLMLGDFFRANSNLRQAAQQYSRITELLPEDPFSRIRLARVFLDFRQPDWAMEQVRETRSRNTNDLGDLDLELIDIQARALLLKNEFATAEILMMETLEQNLKDESRHRLVFQFYVAAGDLVKAEHPDLAQVRYQKAIGILDQLNELNPNSQYQLNKASLLIRGGKAADAIPVLDKLIQAEPANTGALMNRAIVHLELGHMELAKADYLALEKLMSADLHKVYFGLAQIAEKTKDGPGMLKYYRDYLKAAPPGTAEYQQVSNRLKELEGGKKS